MFVKSSSVLILLASAWCAACQPRKSAAPPVPTSHTEKFLLSAGPSCADGYPATIDEARFITPNGGSFPVPYGHFLNGNWGRSGIGWAVGDEMQAAPDSLEIRWFSYTENKFYEGHFLLPQEKLYALLKQGYWQADEKKQGTYSNLTVTVVPTGVVVVWLSGRLNKVLIGRYQAREIEYDYERFMPGSDRVVAMQEAKAAMSPAARHAMATGTVSSRQWDAYLKTYPWRLEFSRPLTLGPFGVDYLNAEGMEDPPTPDQAAFAQLLLAPGPKPVPTALGLEVTGPYGRQRRLDLALPDEAETMAAFQALHARHPQEPIVLFVDVDEPLTQATLSLRAGGQVVPLPKSMVESWPVK